MPAAKFTTPRFTVYLFKSISRKKGEQGLPTSERYADKEDFIELTDYFGDGSSITTTKSVNQVAGTFSITFYDKPDINIVVPGSAESLKDAYSSMESIYGLVEPMDVVEIRMWNGEGIKPTTLPIKMRGFVSEISRGRQMGVDGKPRRMVTVSGHDYGKILQMCQMLMIPGYPGTPALLTGFGFSEQVGDSMINVLSGKDFIKKILDTVVNPMLDKLLPQYSNMPREILPDVQAEGTVSVAFQDMKGSIASCMASLLDVGDWNEMYVEDAEDGVYLVWRPKPYFDLMTGVSTQDLKMMPRMGTILDSDIVAVRQVRNDNDIYNYFWVTNEQFNMLGDDFAQANAAQANAHAETVHYPNTNVDYYGNRALYANTTMGAPDMDYIGSGLSKDALQKNMYKIHNWLGIRRASLILDKRDNVVFERGTMQIKGGPARNNLNPNELSSEPLRAGDYFKVLDGRLEWTGYVVSITDNFQPFRTYTTTINFERGTGFADRVSDNGGANPYLKEMAIRPDADDSRRKFSHLDNDNRSTDASNEKDPVIKQARGAKK
ncbi:hypothetical protein ID007_004339 [Salmonella enterica]|nr:hypothetical protein [Salmonella enterica]